MEKEARVKSLKRKRNYSLIMFSVLTFLTGSQIYLDPKEYNRLIIINMIIIMFCVLGVKDSIKELKELKS